ncbi:MAG: hypothetical protein HY730_07925 [Candidatus Tectomicrobia bacterium]|uniref:Uncharacterized protein n=1 Tax=Tectimicrobiota bacterium TaxID=2528274 RepID=A0A933GPH8_UNCTE|nr:hypothetical protein [Candidatus Tectomicrobia bacterium]
MAKRVGEKREEIFGKKAADLFTKAQTDEGLSKKLLSDPKGVLKEHGIDVPEGISDETMNMVVGAGLSLN